MRILRGDSNITATECRGNLWRQKRLRLVPRIGEDLIEVT